MPYIAQKRLKVGHDEESDTPIYRERGEEIPEAASWPWQTLRAYEREGHIKDVPAPATTSRTKEKVTHG